jgi:cholest-4-en-3-one 26-monooxygenase
MNGIDPLDLVDADRYARRGYPHEVWARLRAEAHVAYFEPPGFRPFWAITKFADITQISAQPLRF